MIRKITDKKLLEENVEIEKIFQKIVYVAQEYLDTEYPGAPDPDLYIEKMERLIDKYWVVGECDLKSC